MTGFSTSTWIYHQNEGGQPLILSHFSGHTVVVNPPPEKQILDAFSLPEDGENLCSQHLLVPVWCKYAAFQFHSILSVPLSSLSLIVQLFLKGQLLLIQLMASQWSLNWLRAPAYLEELWWRWCLTLLRCDVLSRMPSQLEELMWQLSAGRKKNNNFFLKLLFSFCSICPVLLGCTRGPCSHLLSRPLKESSTGATLPAKQTGGVWRRHVKSCLGSSRNQNSWLLISWELTWGIWNHSACEAQSNHTELSFSHLHFQQFLFREMPCAYGNICLYSQLTFNLSQNLLAPLL